MQIPEKLPIIFLAIGALSAIISFVLMQNALSEQNNKTKQIIENFTCSIGGQGGSAFNIQGTATILNSTFNDFKGGQGGASNCYFNATAFTDENNTIQNNLNLSFEFRLISVSLIISVLGIELIFRKKERKEKHE